MPQNSGTDDMIVEVNVGGEYNIVIKFSLPIKREELKNSGIFAYNRSLECNKNVIKRRGNFNRQIDP